MRLLIGAAPELAASAWRTSPPAPESAPPCNAAAIPQDHLTSADGKTWTELHRVTRPFPRTVHLGLAVCSQAHGIHNLTRFEYVRVE